MGFQFAVPRRSSKPPPSPYRQLAQPGSLPPPVGGWNKRDALPSMPPTDALRLDNWIPDTASVRLRKGFAPWATGLPAFVESLMEYAPPTGSNKLFAATPAAIYDVTASGAVGAAVQSTLSNGRWQYTQFANAAGNYLYIVNGTDTPRYYDGTVWTNSTFTGLTIANLIGVAAHMNRLWFIEKNTLNAWYGATLAIAGALTKFSPPFKLGGFLQAIASWSRDGGSGPDDHIVFLTNKGEAAVYAGTDPSSASTSALIGIFKLPEPIGKRCFLAIGSDLGVLTSQGIVPFSAVLGTSPSGAGKSAITNKIVGAFRESYNSSGTNHGWQLVEYPKQNLLIANIPIAERTTQYQYVMNTNTGAWCRFTGIPAGCWSLLGDVLYFGGNNEGASVTGVVYKYDTDYLDNTVSVTATLQTAYSTFGTVANKLFTMARPLFLSPPSYTPLVSVRTDYDTANPDLAVVPTTDSGTAWNVGDWNTSSWGASQVPSLSWQTVQGVGMAGSIAFAVAAQSELVFNGVDVAFEVGGLL